MPDEPPPVRGIRGVIERAGHHIVDRIDDADVVLFNGCMVRQKAEEKVYGRIGAVVEEKRRRRVVLGVGGCLGQIRGESLLRRFPSIDFLFGARGHAALPQLIERVDNESTRFAALDPSLRFDDVPFRRASDVSAMVTITEGCSNYCSYCVVPFARGPMRSRDRDRIVSEVESLAAAGFREVLLLGQNVNAYGTDDGPAGTFVDLLRRVSDTGIQRIRFTSSHPRDMDLGVFSLMVERPNVCPHIHLACQSGSDRILQAMNRGTTRAGFLDIVRAGRGVVPELNVTTDLIVGYPGETPSDFEETLSLLEEARFGTVFGAMYSARPLTKAAQLADDVPQHEKRARLHRLLERQRAIALEENERFVGEDVEVLIDGIARSGASYGRARDHRTVLVDGRFDAGQVVRTRVEAVSAAALSGVVRPKGTG